MRDFLTVQALPYLGQLSSQPVSLLSKSEQPPASCVIDLLWSLYGAGVNKNTVSVNINLETGVVNPIDKLMSIYIDNTASRVTVYVIFPDTKYTVVCAPGAAVYQPVIGQSRKFVVVADGFHGADGLVSQMRTVIQASNVYVQPATNYERNVVHPQYIGTIRNSVGQYNFQKYRDLAVGDLTWSGWISLDGSYNDHIILDLSSYASGYYMYITNIQATICDARSSSGYTGSVYAKLWDELGYIDIQLPYVRRWNLTSLTQFLNMTGPQLKAPTSKLHFSRSALGIGDLLGAGTEGSTNTGPVVASLLVNYSIVDEKTI